MRTLLRFIPLMLLPLTVTSQNVSPDPWADWKFLVGEWTAGESSGVPGQASKGSFTLAPDLSGQVLVRKNHAEYPPVNGRPAIVHDDLMIIYRTPPAPGKYPIQAFYADNEGHVIHYNVSISPDKKSIVFLSEKIAEAPQYRLTYEDVQPGTAKIIFEIAPPDKPDRFTKYVEAAVHRKT
jgi:hypothetical protein